MYANLRTNLPREVMAFSDFPFDASFPGSADARQFPGHAEVRERKGRWGGLPVGGVAVLLQEGACRRRGSVGTWLADQRELPCLPICLPCEGPEVP